MHPKSTPKNFDTRDHGRLNYDFKIVGIKGNAGKILRSYLQNRDLKARVEKIKSTTIQLTTSVPQGSVLGPLLYLVYTNNIKKRVQNIFCTLYIRKLLYR